ncbi:DUF1232 domain-containing protein [Microcoleus sp. AT9_B5]
MQSLKQVARRLKKETYAVYLASTDQRVPWYARILAGLTVAYAFSPIDLIPDRKHPGYNPPDSSVEK